jgi:hypothetical protein
MTGMKYWKEANKENKIRDGLKNERKKLNEERNDG